MKEQEKQLLLKDLCARLPYGVIVEYGCNHEGKDLGERQSKLTGRMIDSFFGSIPIGMSKVYSLRPYLRPMSSMTEEEWEDFYHNRILFDGHGLESEAVDIDWLNEHHFDFRGFIPMGLALVAPEGMYVTKTE